MQVNFFTSLLNNILITVLSCIIPVLVGIAFNYIYSASENPTVSKLSRLFGTVFESICPLVLLTVLYFSVARHLRIRPFWVCVIGFSISFIGYLPLHINDEYSFVKNTVVNALGLASTVFKWSFCVSFISVVDLLRYATVKMSSSYNALSFIPVLAVSFIILLVLELARFFVRENME